MAQNVHACTSELITFGANSDLRCNCPAGTLELLPFGANLDIPWDLEFPESPYCGFLFTFSGTLELFIFGANPQYLLEFSCWHFGINSFCRYLGSPLRFGIPGDSFSVIPLCFPPLGFNMLISLWGTAYFPVGILLCFSFIEELHMCRMWCVISCPNILWSFFVAFKNPKTLLSLPQSFVVGSYTLVHNKDTDVSRCGLDFFAIHNSFSVIEWNLYIFYWYISCDLLCILNMFCFVGLTSLFFTSFWNIILTSQYAVVLIFPPLCFKKNWYSCPKTCIYCLLYLLAYQICFLTMPKILVLTLSYMCEILSSSTNHPYVHCLPFSIWFATQSS